VTPPQYARVKEIFLRACELETGLRGDFLDEECAGDVHVRAEVESLLANDAAILQHVDSRSGRPESAPSDTTQTLLMPGAGPVTAPGPPTAARPAPSRSPEPIYHGRFLPGTILGGRYRIVALLGEGGMGEVYRADDLKLGQTVALKFLPPLLECDPASLSRFHDEVRLARHISHPNVCRVYDIDEVEGHHFLSMEYVDGEDLASLLRRIGRFPEDRALEVARQLCAGLAAAHGQGVLHLDLKPANVMIDGRGKVLIHDFGLACLADKAQGAAPRAGTPGYMAPEQWSGQPASTRTDLYALGLVLYEVFTGKPAVTPQAAAQAAASIGRTVRITSPTPSISGILDPAVERAISRCLAQDPSQRPESALAVLADLPGGDPIAAAMAAGRTLSAEMLAAAPSSGRLRPLAAAAVLLLCCAGLLANVMFCARLRLLPRLALPKSPEVLADRAREVIRELGYARDGSSTGGGFAYDIRYERQIPADARVASRDDPSPPTDVPPPVVYWFRQSPRPLVPRPIGLSFSATRVTETNPPAVEPGMTSVRLDAQGRLLEFVSVPRPVAPADGFPPPPEQQAAASQPMGQSAPDWQKVIGLTQLAPLEVSSVAPVWIPPVWCDRRAAWQVRLQDEAKPGTRIEAGALRGRIVWARVLRPAELARAARDGEPAPRDGRSLARSVLHTSLILATLVGAALLAYANIRNGRADRRGTLRLAAFVFAVLMLMWVVAASHAPGPEEEVFFVALPAVARALFWAAVLWVVYVALEPHARRLWPRRLISWTRVLGGRWRDPLVGRDVLIGCTAGILMLPSLGLLDVVGQRVFHLPERIFVSLAPLDPLLGLSFVAEAAGNALLAGIHWGLMVLFVPVLLSLLVRRAWAGVALAGLLWTLMGYLPHQEGTAWPLIWEAVAVAFPMFVALRFGLLAATCMYAGFFLIADMPITSDAGSWYASVSNSCQLALLALCSLACWVSLGGRPQGTGRGLQD
jgi:serine/threonine-protein kinase